MMILLLDVFLIGTCLSALFQEKGRWEIPASKPASGMMLMENGRENETGERIGEKVIALTFDDGPHKKYTKKLLDGLKKRGVKASFFLVGENIPGNEMIVRRMAEDGHFIGVHCYSHVDLTRQKTEDACRDIRKTAQMIEEITGRRPECNLFDHLHDVFSTSVDAALAAVDTLEKQGYTFVTVEELLID